MIRDAVRAFARPSCGQCSALDKERPFSERSAPGTAALGAYGICVPEEFGGANLDT